MPDVTYPSPVRDRLRELLDSADDATLAANAEQIEGALRCPIWCIAAHGVNGDFTVHHSIHKELVGEDGDATIWLAQAGDDPTTVVVQADAYLTAEQAQTLTAMILANVAIAAGDGQ